MKNLILKIIVFCLPLILVVVVFRSFIQYKKQQPEQYQFNFTIENLILGHSQPECALNDSIIYNTINKCQGGEAYIYTYTKLKKLLAVNNQIKTVYLSFSNNQIEKAMDKWIYNETFIVDKYPKYFYEMDFSDKRVLLKGNFKSVLLAESKILKSNLTDFIKHKGQLKAPNYWGDYLYLDRQKIDSLVQEDFVKMMIEQRGEGISEVNLSYLKKIVELCEKEEVKLVFFRTPIHQVLRKTYDEKIFDSIRKKHFKSILFLDCIDYPLSNDKFVDFEHLNYKGANDFSVFFNQLVQNKSITQDQVNALIEQEIENKK